MRVAQLLTQLQKMNNLNLSSDVVFEMLSKMKSSPSIKKNSNAIVEQQPMEVSVTLEDSAIQDNNAKVSIST